MNTREAQHCGKQCSVNSATCDANVATKCAPFCLGPKLRARIPTPACSRCNGLPKPHKVPSSTRLRPAAPAELSNTCAPVPQKWLPPATSASPAHVAATRENSLACAARLETRAASAACNRASSAAAPFCDLSTAASAAAIALRSAFARASAAGSLSSAARAARQSGEACGRRWRGTARVRKGVGKGIQSRGRRCLLRPPRGNAPLFRRAPRPATRRGSAAPLAARPCGQTATTRRASAPTAVPRPAPQMAHRQRRPRLPRRRRLRRRKRRTRPRKRRRRPRPQRRRRQRRRRRRRRRPPRCLRRQQQRAI